MEKIASKTSYNLEEIFKISLFNFTKEEDWSITETNVNYCDADNLLWSKGICGKSTSNLMDFLGDDYIYDKIEMEFRLKPHIVIEYKNGRKSDILVYDNYANASNDFSTLNNALSHMSFRFQVL